MFRQVLLLCCFILWLLTLPNQCFLEKIKYVALERPVIQYYSKKYFPYMNVTARRYSRNDPNYYFSAYFVTSFTVNNNFTGNFYYYKFSSDTYTKTHIEIHLRACDLLKDKLIGSFMSRGSFTKCPSPPGSYYVANSTLSLEHIPKFFKLEKGRVHTNLIDTHVGEIVASGYIDLEIKEKLVKIKYISLERPVLQYYNKKYLDYFNLTARRYSRADPNYYFTSYFNSLLPLDNKITLHFYIYEFSNNIYKKTFFELHFKLCDLLNQDKFIGSFLSKGTMVKCPLPPGTYYVANSTLSIDNLPSYITVKKCRVQWEVNYLSTREVLMSAYGDFEIKERLIKPKKSVKKN